MHAAVYPRDPNESFCCFFQHLLQFVTHRRWCAAFVLACGASLKPLLAIALHSRPLLSM